MKLLKQFIQQETVLTAAAVLAVVSAFFVPPDAQYLGYIDLRTLAILFSLMTVMAGLRRQGLAFPKNCDMIKKIAIFRNSLNQQEEKGRKTWSRI